MRHSKRLDRRRFLKGTVAMGAASALTGYRSLLAGVPEDFITVGICRGPSQAQAVANAGAAYIEASVRGFLVPDQAESVFLGHLKTIRDAGLATPACNSFLPGSIKSVGPDRDLAKLTEWAEIAFQRAQHAGVRHIIYGSGSSRRIPEEYSRAQAKRDFVEVLERMAPIAQKYGVIICHGPEEVSRYAKFIHTLHIAENENRQPPGTHGDDFRPFFRMLRETGFTGNCSIECRWTDLDAQGPVAVGVVKRQIADVFGEDS
jgi:sugar phosphate isomerase/epimerase